MRTSTINQWTYPEFDDSPDIRLVKTLADQIDTSLLPAMTAAQSVVTYPGGVPGALIYMTDQQSLCHSHNGSWLTAAETEGKSSVVDYRSTDATTYVPIDDMRFPVLEGGSYLFEGVFLMRMDATNSILIRWQCPTATRAAWSDQDVNTPTNLSSAVTYSKTTNVLSMSRFYGYVITVSEDGFLYPEIRKSTNTATTTDSEIIMRSGSWCRIMRVG